MAGKERADNERFDLVVVGSGPGGYVAAVRAAQLGLRVACVERDARTGGVCLNVGCIPSKALLDSSEFYALAGERLAEHGVVAKDVRLDLAAMMARKEKVVQGLCDNVRKLLEGSGVVLIRGVAKLVGAQSVEVTRPEDVPGESRPFVLEGRSILLATGSEPVELPSLPFDGTHIVSSTEALSFESVPEHLVIVGGGYIGLELGSVWARLGARVTVVEKLPRIVGTLDGQVVRALERTLTRQGLTFRLRTGVLGAEVVQENVRVALDVEGGGKDELLCDRLLVAVGRRPLTAGLGIEDVGVRLEEKTGRLWVDEHYRTSVPSILAIGDLVSGPMLAHKASAEGVAAVECLAGLPGEVNYDSIPSVVYTAPEVASVGLTEEVVRERGIEVRIGSASFAGNGRARCLGEAEGFVKLIVHARTDRILGVHIIGPRASDLISEAVLALEFSATAEDIARTVHGHPTFAEALHEAALIVRQGAVIRS